MNQRKVVKNKKQKWHHDVKVDENGVRLYGSLPKNEQTKIYIKFATLEVLAGKCTKYSFTKDNYLTVGKKKF